MFSHVFLEFHPLRFLGTFGYLPQATCGLLHASSTSARAVVNL
jgi:hypothetical protein